jgi:Lipase (class 3)
MTSIFDVRNLVDVATLAAIVRSLRPFDPVNAIPAALGMINGGPFDNRTFPRAPPLPAWLWCDTREQVIVCIDGILTTADGLNVFGSTLQPLSTVGNWSTNSALVDAADELMRQMAALLGRGPRHWCISGHSYGGSIACVLAALLSDGGFAKSVQVCSFGSPRPGSSSLASRLTRETVRRYMNDDDPVPRFPPRLTEAPLLVGAAGFGLAVQWGRYVQPQGGVVLDSMGHVHIHELPPFLLPITDLKLAGWAFSDRGFLATGHSMGEYLTRTLLAAAAGMPSAAPPVAGSQVEEQEQLTQQAFTLAVAGAATKVASPSEVSPVAQGYIPVLFRAKAELIGGNYVVTWMGNVVLTGHNRNNARSLAAKLNLFLRVMQGAASADHTNFNTSLANYWTVCSGAGIGFNPVLVVT